jgi:hypothetical protein
MHIVQRLAGPALAPHSVQRLRQTAHFRYLHRANGSAGLASVIHFPLQLARAKSQDDRQAESEFRVRDRFRSTPLPADADTFDKIVARLLVARRYMLW